MFLIVTVFKKVPLSEPLKFFNELMKFKLDNGSTYLYHLVFQGKWHISRVLHV